MKCRFLSGNYLLACRAENRIYMPSFFEIEEYCKSNRHKVCPLYFKVKSEDRPGMQAVKYPLYTEARR